MQHAVAYVRVSTDEQAREGVSLDAQDERLRAYCTMTGIAVTAVIREEGVSGSIALSHRPGEKEVLRLVRTGTVQHIVALKLDRLFRDAEDALRQTREWDQAGIALHLVDMGGQSLNTASAIGRLFLTMTAAFAELERNLTAERTKAALEHKKRHGQAYSPTPYGYTREGDRLIADPAEQIVIARILKMHVAGTSLRQIAATLNSESIPGKAGGKWYASTVRSLVLNDLHQG
ncbi:MAG TPA: recombinase family protein [Armatimonadota bacterium]|nr:recombinase family protein [Armatimonadota bacterium]